MQGWGPGSNARTIYAIRLECLDKQRVRVSSRSITTAATTTRKQKRNPLQPKTKKGTVLFYRYVLLLYPFLVLCLAVASPSVAILHTCLLTSALVAILYICLRIWAVCPPSRNSLLANLYVCFPVLAIVSTFWQLFNGNSQHVHPRFWLVCPPTGKSFVANLLHQSHPFARLWASVS